MPIQMPGRRYIGNLVVRQGHETRAYNEMLERNALADLQDMPISDANGKTKINATNALNSGLSLAINKRQEILNYKMIFSFTTKTLPSAEMSILIIVPGQGAYISHRNVTTGAGSPALTLTMIP
jgi:hypothetical protein